MKISLSRGLLLLIAAFFGFATATILVYLIASQPVHLRVAVGPKDRVDADMLAAFDRILEINKVSVRLDLVNTAGLQANNELLEKREVDLAVVRLDDPLPSSAMVIVLLRTNVVIAVAPARHKLENFSDLKGKRVGLIPRSPLDEPSFNKLLDVFGLKPTDLKLAVINPDEVAEQTKSGRIDCVVVFGVPADPEVAAVVYAVDGTKKNPPKILAVDVGAFLKESSPAAADATIAKHAFPRRMIPDDDVDTVGVPTALAANTVSTGPLRHRLYNNAITDVTKNLLERRSELARKVPLASLIAAPDTDKGARFPIHPGASAYLGDTDTSWFTLFSDQIWNVLLVGGLLSSIATAAAGFLKKQETDPMRALLDRLKAIAERARSATAPEEADELSRDLGTLAIDIATAGYERHSRYEEFAPLQLAFENTRDAVEELRRRKQPPAPRPVAAAE
jgi:TRAP-type uncharacterized transport system substrate-binding protein